MSLCALSVDLEEYFQVSNFEAVIPRDTWDALPSRVQASTERLLAAFDEHDCRATFFSLGWVAERQPALLRAIAERGHEIACHGYGHQLVYDIGPDRFRADLKRARIAIEDACGHSVRGYRAPSYSITERSLWALEILAEEGFEYDSSIFPIRHHRYGIPSFARHPVRLQLESGAELREFPITTVEAGPLRLPLAGGAYLRFFPAQLFHWGLKRMEAAAEPFVIYTHPWEIDPGQPRQAVSWRVLVNHYFNLHRTEDRLRGLLGRFPFRSVHDVLESLAAADRLPVERIDGYAAAA